MAEIDYERSRRWDMYSSSNPTTTTQTGESSNQESPWRSSETSMNAISYGFVATAILITMFLVMAVFEHLFGPNSNPNPNRDPNFSSSLDEREGSIDLESRAMQKLGDSEEEVQTSYARSDFSVVMPGQLYPTFIAQPAPLPCPREEVYWPSHEINFLFPS